MAITTNIQEISGIYTKNIGKPKFVYMKLYDMPDAIIKKGEKHD